MANIADIKSKYGVTQNDAEIHMTVTQLANKLSEYLKACIKYKGNPNAQVYWHDKLRDTLATARYDAAQMAKLVNEYTRKMDTNGL